MTIVYLLIRSNLLCGVFNLSLFIWFELLIIVVIKVINWLNDLIIIWLLYIIWNTIHIIKLLISVHINFIALTALVQVFILGISLIILVLNAAIQAGWAK